MMYLAAEEPQNPLLPVWPEVVIDGVVFQFEQGGQKLTRIGGMLAHQD